MDGMVFSSVLFVFLFLPVVFLVNLKLPCRVSNYFLLLVSLLAYAWGEPVYVLLMIACTLINYLLSLGFAKVRKRKLLLAVTVVLNIGVLCLYKYADFFIGTVNSLFMTKIPLTGIPLPIGISFFTFQAMSYSIDVYRGVNPPQKSFAKLLLYISLFPQLIAGPIVNYHDIEASLNSRKVNLEEASKGIRRFIVGLSKKLLIANVLAVIADQVYDVPLGGLNAPLAWMGALTYAAQIYFDFSGYSDMAIGMGHMLGFTFLENFRYPYSSSSIRVFWQRWHISLSTWFREYVYIPLGGNRKGRWRTGLNRMLVFFLTGLWHGAEWTFVVWGLGHGLLLLLETYGILPADKLKPRFKWLGHLYVLMAAVCLFVFFRSSSFAQALDVLKSMFAGWHITVAQQTLMAKLLTPHTLIVFAAAVIGSTSWLKRAEEHLAQRPRLNTCLSGAAYVMTLALFCFCIASLTSSSHNPFIYFRF